MKRKYLAKAGVFALAAGIILPSTVAHGEVLPSSISASTENVNNTEINDEKLSIEVYDKDGKLVKTYSKEELEKFNQEMATTPLRSSNFEGNIQKDTEINPLAMNVYNFGETDVTNFQWVRNKTSFYRPQSVQVEPKDRTVGLAIQLYANSVFHSEYKVKGAFSSGLNIPIAHLLGDYNNYYQLGLKNYGGGTIHLESGQVYYK